MTWGGAGPKQWAAKWEPEGLKILSEKHHGNLLSTLAKQSPPKCSFLSHKLGSAEERGHESPLMRW